MTHTFLPLLVSSLLHAGCDAGSVTGPPLSPGSWPRHYELSATHSEQQYVENVRLLRSGSDFVLIGGVSPPDLPLRITVQVGSDGSIRGTDAAGREIVCPDAVAIPCALPLRGLLASAAVLAAARRGAMPQVLVRAMFAGRCVICVDAAQIAAAAAPTAPLEPPIVDPCLDARTGAVLAFRHRRSGQFEGASLDPESIHIAVGSVVRSQIPGARQP